MTRRAIVLFFEDIPGFDGKYGISEDGIVYNWETKNFIFPYLNTSLGRYMVNLSFDEKQNLYRLHRLLAKTFILNPGNLKFVDHIDRDKTNNSLSNLRWCTTQENNRNSTKSENKSSIYKGVNLNKQNRKWRTLIRVDGKLKHLGYFTDEIEAAKVYDRAAREYFGEYANPNFPEEEDISFDSEEEN